MDADDDDNSVLWDDPTIEKRWGTEPGYMSDQRKKGQGPRFLRLSARVVRYRPKDVKAYEAQQEFNSIAESMASDFTAPAGSPGAAPGRLAARKAERRS
jgi:hypothetical protein